MHRQPRPYPVLRLFRDEAEGAVCQPLFQYVVNCFMLSMKFTAAGER